MIHEAIIRANVRAVVDVLANSPEDVNLLDASHRSVLFCAIVGYE